MSAPRTPAPSTSPLGRWLAILATVVVVATLAAAFMVMRSPGEQRKVTLDQRRVQDLMQLSRAVEAHWEQYGRLPEDQHTLVDGQRLRRLPLDPESGGPYSLAALAQDRYQLCATFSRASGESALGDFWAHGAGLHCFAFRLAPR